MRTNRLKRKGLKRKGRERGAEWLRLPRLAIRWQAWCLPPAVVVLAGAFLLAGRAALDRPVRHLTIEGEFQRVTELKIEAAIGRELGGGFLSIPLEKLRGRIESLDWVARATVGRRWPDTLVVAITEHKAAARWGEHGLLNVEGELFTETARHRFPELPQLAGPPGTERTVAGHYLSIRGRLIEAQLALERLDMDERGALSFRLTSGQEIRIGRDEIDLRIDRFFIVAAPLLHADFDAVDYVDLRYTNGFAVGWKPAAEPESELRLSLEEAARSG